MKFDHSKLLGKMRELGVTQVFLAKKVGISQTTLIAKLKNKNYFTTREIECICEMLNISKEEIHSYFFVKKV